MATILPSQSSSISKTNNKEDHKDEKIEKIKRIYKSYKEVISTLPKEKEAFDMFCKRISSYGTFWDHVLEYWKTCLVCPERVLFLNYEDMKRDTFIHVKKLAEFLGQPFSLEEESEGIEQGIVELCSFENLSNLEVNKNRTLRNGIKGDMFFRKGQVGDWKNHLTAQMIECLDQITKEKLGGLFF
ncbi:hypothetical protein ACSBR2_024185 [Camellia fascicularis]